MEHGGTLNVLLVAPPLIRWGLERLLRTASAHVELCAPAFSMQEAEDALHSTFPDVLVALVEKDSVPAARRILANASCRAVAIAEPALRPQLLDLGLEAVLPLQATPSEFLLAVLADGDRHPKPLVAGALCVSSMPPAARTQGVPMMAELTPQQQKILEALASHQSAPVKVIASKLHLSDRTVRNHLTEVYSKLGVRGRLQLQSLLANQGTQRAL